MKDNNIADFEAISPLLATMQRLRVLDLRGNELAQVKKYRDQVVMTGLSVRVLDDKEVTEHERQYLLTLEMKKRGIKIPTKAPSKYPIA